jgi:hypothetical protein
METYIVRIYRNSGMQLVGMLEAVEYGWQRPFRNVTELLAVLEQAFRHGVVSTTCDRADSSGYPAQAPRRVAQ